MMNTNYKYLSRSLAALAISALTFVQPLSAQSPGYEAKAKELGIEFNTAAKPNDHFVPAVQTGNLVFLSGHGPRKPEGGPG